MKTSLSRLQANRQGMVEVMDLFGGKILNQELHEDLGHTEKEIGVGKFVGVCMCY